MPTPPRVTDRPTLRFTRDNQPGFSRRLSGRHFIYFDTRGRRITDPRVVQRIRKLAIPPAYKQVWICPQPDGHLQATGRDARGRKQYRYHPQWREHRDATKFDRMLEFGRTLPRVRRRVAKDLRTRGLPKEKVLATIVRLLECTLIRVGNEEYARSNGSYGLTTLRDRHVGVRAGALVLEFRGKSGVRQRARVADRRVVNIVRDCRDIPGQELFQWIDARGAPRPIDSSDVNDYLREASGADFTAKDFRTWFATLEALTILRKQRAATGNEARKQIVAAVKVVSERLGNTPAICRKCYIHPEVLSAHEKGGLKLLNGTRAPLALRRLLSPAHKTKKSRKNPTYLRARARTQALLPLTAVTRTPA